VRGNVDGLTRRQLLPAHTVERARALRRNATDAERLLWRALREAFPAARFRRQAPSGPYFADFCSHGARLVIEVDGGQHAGRTGCDATRTRVIGQEGYRVLRSRNDEVLRNINGVLGVLAAVLPSSSCPALPGGALPLPPGQDSGENRA